MLNKIDNCENFGSPSIIARLIKNCDRKEIKISDIVEFFRRGIYTEFFYIEDILTLLVFLNILEIKKDFIILTKFGKDLSTKNQEEFNYNFKNLLISKILGNPFLGEFLNGRDISYDYYSGSYVIKNSKIFLKYFALRNLLIKLGILERIKNTYLFRINKPLINLLKEKNRKNPKIITLDKLKESLLIKETYGYEAEEFVLKYEKSRLRNNPHLKKIKIVSDLDVCAGYDIISYKDSISEKHIFLEVKSYSGKISFYWSKNEIEVSKEKQDDYYLYLVNRDKIKEKGYVPKIIKNPYKKIFCDESGWKKTVESWLFNRR